MDGQYVVKETLALCGDKESVYRLKSWMFAKVLRSILNIPRVLVGAATLYKALP